MNQMMINIANYPDGDNTVKLQLMKINAPKAIPVDDVRDIVIQMLESMSCVVGRHVFTNEDESVFYKLMYLAGNKTLPIPFLIIVDRHKLYRPFVETLGLDASALFEYEGIVRKARAGVEKNQSTCDAVLVVADEIVLRLSNVLGFGNKDFPSFAVPFEMARVYELRGMIDKAKFCVYKIWQEGKKREPIKVDVVKLHGDQE